ncbi:MAG: fimbrillin family protein [Bacteroidales bacterium]|nr:fimbrillin family protein [Bacteroidales bacterium]
MKKISILLASMLLAAACQPQWDMVPPPGSGSADELGPEAWEHSDEIYFVSLYGDGDMDGSTWENALDLGAFRDLMNDNTDLSRVTFYVAEGKYLMGDAPGYGLAIAKSVGLVKGGFSRLSTGDDISKCHPEAYPTVFSGDVNGNGTADEGDCTLIKVTSGTCTFENITFQGGYINETYMNADKAQAAGIAINGNAASCIFNAVRCRFEDIRSTVTTATYAGGAAIRINGGQARVRDCSFTGNAGVSRGGAVRLCDKNSILLCDRCYFGGNTLSDVWGTGLQLSYGHLCMNNCTVYDNTGNGGQVNGGGSFFIASSTIVGNDGDRNNCVVRLETSAGDQAYFINNLIFSLGTSASFVKNKSNDQIVSKGYNLYQSESNGSYGSMISATDTQLATRPAGTVEDGVFVWDPAQVSVPSRATAEWILEALGGYAPAGSPVANLGSVFQEWVGASGFSVDQRGMARDADGFVPGAYEPVAPASGASMAVTARVAQASTKAGATGDNLSAFQLIVHNAANAAFDYNVTLQRQGALWTPADGSDLYWDDALSPVTVVAFAPAASGWTWNGRSDFSVRTDQRSETALIASDLVLTQKTVDPQQDLVDGKMALVLDHLLSKLSIQVRADGTLLSPSAIGNLTVHGTAPRAVIDLTAATPAVTAAGDPADIMLLAADTAHEGIVVPQIVADGLKVTFTYDGKLYTWEAPGAVSFDSGKQYSLEVTLAR